jgi:DNA polymerase III subunit alpha
MANYYTFSCGCKFPIIGDSTEYPRIHFVPTIENINLDCSMTWDLISEGNTKGCFQLESRLGQMMAKKLKPSNIEQLSALIAIIRPGCLEAIRDDKSVTNHYIDRKNGKESIDYFHPILEQTLKDTFGEMIYQEQAMEIARIVAGFDLKQADELRKSIGKKNVELMSKVKTKFLEGCKEQKSVSEDEAEEIFGWIEKSQRYSFNKSHSISYAINGYLSAYAKAHFPKIFFASYLKFAKDKIDPQQEIKELIRNASEMDISIRIPDFRLLNELFIIHDQSIFFGLTDIKGVGNSVYKKIIEITNDINLNTLNKLQVIIKILLKINSTASKALIKCGAFDYLRTSRTEMLFEYDLCSALTDKEVNNLEKIVDYNNNVSLKVCLEQLITTTKITQKRSDVVKHLIHSIIKPPYSLVDKIEWLSDCENDLLGAAISCSKLDTYDITMTNTTCKTFKNSNLSNNIIIAGEIANINIVKTKTGKTPGQEMAFLTIEDQTGLIDSVIMFPESWMKYKPHMYIGNILIFVGNRSKTKDGLIVDKCFVPKA